MLISLSFEAVVFGTQFYIIIQILFCGRRHDLEWNSCFPWRFLTYYLGFHLTPFIGVFSNLFYFCWEMVGRLLLAQEIFAYPIGIIGFCFVASACPLRKHVLDICCDLHYISCTRSLLRLFSVYWLETRV